MKPFASENVHVWQGTAHILCDTQKHGLTYFKTTDETVNFLFLNGYREEARALNAHIKESLTP